MHVVVVGADITANFLTNRVLQREKAISSVTFFHSALPAVDYLQRQAERGTLPAALLLDVPRPLLNGWDVLDTLQPLASTLCQHCPVYALISSTWANEAAYVKLHPVVAGVFYKPFDGLKLQQLLSQMQAK